MNRWFRICAEGTLGALFAFFSLLSFAQDYEREARWRTEIEPTVIVGDVVDLTADNRRFMALFTEGKDKTTALVLAHGVGVHPDFGLIGKLRTQLADAGFATLSLQMPVLGKEVTDAAQYQTLFPNASKRFDAAYKWLTAKGYTRVILVSHSMGAWMANVHLATAEKPSLAAWVCIGITGRIGSTGAFSGAILDLTGENDFAVTKDAAWLRRLKLMFHAGSHTVVVPGANHYFENKEREATTAIASFIATLPK